MHVRRTVSGDHKPQVYDIMNINKREHDYIFRKWRMMYAKAINSVAVKNLIVKFALLCYFPKKYNYLKMQKERKYIIDD